MKDSYVVQVYRRDPADPQRLTGTVERIGNGRQQAFNSMFELWAVLTVAPATHRRRPASDTSLDRTRPTNRRKS